MNLFRMISENLMYLMSLQKIFSVHSRHKKCSTALQNEKTNLFDIKNEAVMRGLAHTIYNENIP